MILFRQPASKLQFKRAYEQRLWVKLWIAVRQPEIRLKIWLEAGERV